MTVRSTFPALALAGMLTGPVSAGTPMPQPPVASPHQRVLPLQGGQNFRDLGGYRTADGHSVRWGLLYRSGSMHYLTEADYAYLETLGIRTVCDFRTTRERTAEPAAWPAGHAPQVFADDYEMPRREGTPTTEQEARAAFAAYYPVILAQFKSQYARMFAELLAGRVPLAFNCTAGKDRTGVAAALLLTALGVPRQTILDDYLLTNRYFDPKKVVRNDGKPTAGMPMSPGVVKAYIAADQSYIEAIFKVLDTHAGGPEGYLRDAYGLSHADLVTLRHMYTE